MNTLIHVCCICQRHQNLQGEWVEGYVSDALKSHGYCPTCKDDEIRKARAMVAARNKPEAANTIEGKE